MLDEPTTGLHSDDVKKLIDVLQRLVDHGDTVLVIEHNLDVVKCADWLIDMGPEGEIKVERLFVRVHQNKLPKWNPVIPVSI